MLDTNLTSVFLLCREAGSRMLAHGGGKIVNIASLLSFQGRYHRSSVRRVQRRRSAAHQSTRQRVGVAWHQRERDCAWLYQDGQHQSAAGKTRRATRRSSNVFLAGRWGEAEDIAGAAVFLCSPAAQYIQGHVLTVDGGWMGR